MKKQRFRIKYDYILDLTNTYWIARATCKLPSGETIRILGGLRSDQSWKDIRTQMIDKLKTYKFLNDKPNDETMEL